MSLKVYCPSCGEANQYTINKPNFCGFCGDSFTNVIKQTHSQGSKVEPRPVYKSAPKRIEKNDNNEEIYEDENFQLPQMEGLDVEIQDIKPKRVTLGQVVASAPPNKKDFTPFNRPKQKKIGKKEIESILKQEGGQNPKGHTIEVGGS